MAEERRLALKFAYDGTKFYGFQRQPDKATVEGSLVNALCKIDAIESSRECGYHSSSRTDRGVSALGNIVSFRTAFSSEKLCSAVNSELQDIWAYSCVEVPDNFNPRAATTRWYRYYLVKEDQHQEAMKTIADRFVGVHDFSGHSKRDDRNPMRKIDSIDITPKGLFFAIDFRAQSFLWNMVRRIVWMMNEGSSGRLAMENIGPEAEKASRRIGLAPPENLLLMDIDCGIDFRVDRRAFVGVLRDMERRIRRDAMRLEFAEEISRLIAR